MVSSSQSSLRFSLFNSMISLTFTSYLFARLPMLSPGFTLWRTPLSLTSEVRSDFSMFFSSFLVGSSAFLPLPLSGILMVSFNQSSLRFSLFNSIISLTFTSYLFARLPMLSPDFTLWRIPLSFTSEVRSDFSLFLSFDCVDLLSCSSLGGTAIAFKLPLR